MVNKKRSRFFLLLFFSANFRRHFHTLNVPNKKMSERQTKAGNLEVFKCFLTFSNVTYSHSHSLSLSHCLTLSHSHTQTVIESLLTCWTTFVFISMFKSHSHTHALTLTHSLTLTLSHSLNLSFNHSWHAEQVLFSCLGSKVAVYSRKLQWFFLDIILNLTVPWVLSS